MAERILQDQQARDRIEKDGLDHNMVVLAGAGAGKTYELVERMVNYVRTVSPAVDRIAAITFTRKAAGEMRGRFLLRLQERLEDAQGEEAERLQQALDRVDQCFIGTIHSFCGQLLRERPVEAGIRTDFAELNQREETRLSRKAWDDFVQQCFEDEDTRLETLEDMGLRLADLHSFFNQRCQFSDLKLKVRSIEKPDLRKAVKAAREFMQEVQEHIPDPLPDGQDAFMEVLERAQLFLNNCNMESDKQRVSLLKILHGLEKKAVTLKRWIPNQAFAKSLRDEIRAEFIERVTGPVLMQWRRYIYAYVVNFIDDAVVFYDTQRLSTGSMTFQDLLLRSTRLLRDFPHVRQYFQERYQSLFVDEFQDTDPIQAEMLFYLTGGDREEKDWHSLEPNPGSLFIVGDEKQSIYRFRRADVETFRLAGARLDATGGSIELLNTSFRSLGKLCAWINAAFEPLFAEFDPQYQADFAPLLQNRPDGQDDYCVRQIRIDKVDRHSRKTIAEIETERVVDFIAAALAGKTELNQSGKDALLGERAEPGDFLILTQTRRMLPLYARALEARGISFDVSGGGQLGDLAEVRAFVEMMEVIHRPDHPLPLLGYLRGALVGMGDDELYLLKTEGGHFDYRHSDAIPDSLPEATRNRVQEAFGRLLQVEQRLETRSPAVAFEQAMEELVLPAFAVCEEMGSSRAGSLLRVLSLVRQWDSQGWHWGQVVEELRELIDDTEYKVEEMTLESGQENVVKLMNVHQSKGLQAKVVFLIDAGDRTIDKEDVSFHVSRTGDTPYLSLPVTRSRGEFGSELLAEPFEWELDQEAELKFIQGEKLRLVYVAATRAENLLVVSHYMGKEDAGSWNSLYPYLGDVPELPSYEMVESVVAESDFPNWEELEQDRVARWERVKEPSHKLHSVTEDMADGETLAEGKWGRGRDYGSLVHRFFEMAIKGFLPEDEEGYILEQVLSVGLKEGLVSDVKRALDDFRASEIWAELETSEKVYTEVPFAVSEEGGAVMRGIIDLVYKVEKGWKVVDYKTGASGNKKDTLMEQYAKQVNIYAEKWCEISGDEVVEKGLWLTNKKEWCRI
jgi:ATP-dependent helicase/nuclease subunit A